MFRSYFMAVYFIFTACFYVVSCTQDPHGDTLSDSGLSDSVEDSVTSETDNTTESDAESSTDSETMDTTETDSTVQTDTQEDTGNPSSDTGDTEIDTESVTDSDTDTDSDSDFETDVEDKTLGLMLNEPEASQGLTLLVPYSSTFTYLIDMEGRLVHRWNSEHEPNASAYLLEDGTLLRTKHAYEGVGGFQKIDWDGTVTWDFSYPGTHHDVEPLSNGNVLVIASEVITQQQVLDNGGTSSADIESEVILEIKQTGPTSGEIIWKWRAWEHIVQEQDSEKPNYATVANNPQLLHLSNAKTDWLHANAVAYNDILDQIIVSFRKTSEFFIIDHSTTTEQSQGHLGGHCNMGGDILYRWGNPAMYGQGTIDDQIYIAQHDTHWIKSGLAGAGNILAFNNGRNQIIGDLKVRPYSLIDEIVPAVNSQGCYDRPQEAFGPETVTWTYQAPTPTDFFEPKFSGAQRLKNGNTLICSGSGTLFEVTPSGSTVWIYVNPVGADGPMEDGTVPVGNGVFRAYRYPLDYPGLEGKNLTSGDVIEL